jgi:hypothetical protein
MVAVFGWGLTCVAETVSDTNHYYDIDISLIQSDNYKPPFLHDLLHRLMIDRIYTYTTLHRGQQTSPPRGVGDGKYS